MSDARAPVSRRDFLQTFMLNAAGVTAMAALPIRAPAAWVDWAPPTSSLALGEDPTPGLGLGEAATVAAGTALGDPCISRAADGRIWVVWTEMVGDDERILLRSLDPVERLRSSHDPVERLRSSHDPGRSQWSDLVHVNRGQAPEGSGIQAYQPQLRVADGRARVVWTGRLHGRRSILSRDLDLDLGLGSAAAGPIQVHSTGVDCCRPVISHDIMVWEELHDKALRILGLASEGGSAVDLSRMPACDCRRPAVAVSPTSGEIAVAFDAREGKGHNIHVLRCAAGSTKEISRLRVTCHPASDIAPALAYSPDGQWLWIGWHSNRKADDQWDIPRWFRLAAINTRSGVLVQPPTPPRDRDLDKDNVDQGFELIRLVACPDGGVWVIGRPSHSWCLQRYHGGSWSPIYRLPDDSWGGRGKLASALLDDDGGLWVARRDIRAVIVQRVGGAVSDTTPEPVLVAMPLAESPQRSLRNIEARVEFPPETDELSGEELRFYWGDIHGHSSMSDGMGDVDEHFLRARDLQGDHFFALTDHDHFVGRRLLSSEYEEQKRIVEHFNDPGSFVTLFGQEWTTARADNDRGFGHINFYGIDPDHPMMDHRDERWSTQARVSEAAKRAGLFGGPHHVGWTGYRWSETDPEVITFVEMCSAHGVFEYEGNEPIPHRGSHPGCFVQDGLAAGLKLGFAGGSDQHGLIWHHRIAWKRNVNRTGLTCVLAPELTRQAIADAFRRRRIYATTGVKLRMGFRVNGHLMGSVITSDGPPRFHIDLISPSDIKWVELVRSNQTIVRYGGENLHTFFSRTDEDCPVGTEVWYYLRVILEDRNMAWTSPVWVTRTA